MGKWPVGAVLFRERTLATRMLCCSWRAYASTELQEGIRKLPLKAHAKEAQVTQEPSKEKAWLEGGGPKRGRP